ncbi:MAG: OmpH family outer membrane protein [Opitutae bacterium]|nr:OmpH family outer membrane protein [Opitutae bacterium]
MKMKKMWAATLMAAFVAAVCGAAELKIATVDLDKVFTAHPKTQAAEADLKKAEDAIQAEMERMVAEGRALEESVAKLREAAKNPLLTEEARLTRRNEAEEKLTELQEFQLRARRTQETKLKQMREQVMKSRQGIVDELMAALEQFAQAGGYDLVLDRSGMTMNAIPLVAYSKPELDVTEKLIAFLQAKATAE